MPPAELAPIRLAVPLDVLMLPVAPARMAIGAAVKDADDAGPTTLPPARTVSALLPALIAPPRVRFLEVSRSRFPLLTAPEMVMLPAVLI